MFKIIKNFINGLLFGIIQIVPGISGGTIALMLGFYFQLIGAVNNFKRDFKKNIGFIFPLLTGMILGLVLFASVMSWLLLNYPFPSMMFFIGLITGTVPMIFFYVKEKGRSLKLKHIAIVLIAFILLLLVSFIAVEGDSTRGEIQRNINFPYMLFLFAAGMLSAAALIVPGFSGSFVLLMMGVYNTAVNTLSSLKTLAMDITNTVLLLEIISVLIPLVLGIIFGIIFMAKLIEKLLEKYSKEVYSAILGLIIASIIILFREPVLYSAGISMVILPMGIFTFLLGIFLSYMAARKRSTSQP